MTILQMNSMNGSIGIRCECVSHGRDHLKGQYLLMTENYRLCVACPKMGPSPSLVPRPFPLAVFHRFQYEIRRNLYWTR